MCSRTFSVSGTLPTCSMAPTRIFAPGERGFSPKIRIVPWLGAASPNKSLTAVVLPAPLAPSRETISPRCIRKLTLLRASTGP